MSGQTNLDSFLGTILNSSGRLHGIAIRGLYLLKRSRVTELDQSQSLELETLGNTLTSELELQIQELQRLVSTTKSSP